MVKYLYKTIVLIVVFAAALFFFGQRLESDVYEEGMVFEMGKESLPYLTLTAQNIKMNRLYGYNGPIEDNIVRESITPLGTSKKIKIDINGGEVRLTKLHYDVVDKSGGDVYYSGDVNAIDAGAHELELFLDYGFKTSTEYILALTATTDTGRKVHYFTRLKYYAEDSNLSHKLQFAMKFHEDTFSKSKAEELGRYLEPDGTSANDTLAKVNIKSDSDLVTWGALSPKKISKVVPVIKEYNMETACFQLNYFVEGKTSSGKEIFRVNEFYRVRYASGSSYLLNFERSMEAVFNPKFTSVQKNQIKIGITNEMDMGILEHEKTHALYFSRDGDLYCYDMDKNKNTITKIYSSFSENAAYEYRETGEQGIRLLKADEEGNLYFAVYGYFPRGQYEGKVAIVLYRYDRGEGKLNELVYLPMDTTFQQLRQDFNSYGYVSERNVYYFMVANVVYSYNMEARRLTKVAENITDRGFKVMRQSNCYVWSDSLEKGYGEEITIFHLETEKKVVIPKAAKGEYIRLLGVINDDVIYGCVKKKDVASTKVGDPLVPCYKMVIADNEGSVSKSYARKNLYITGVQVEGNVMTLSRVKKEKDRHFRKISEDSILNQTEVKVSAYSLKSRVTSGTLTEWYIGFPLNFTMENIPDYKVAEDELITGGRSVHLDDLKVPKYYVYALGKITGAYENPAEAILRADEQMGVVISGSHKIVWERSGSFLMNSIAGIEMYKASDKVSNLSACTYMVLKANHFSVSPQKLSAKKLSIYQMLQQYMSEPVDLSGVTLEQALYFVSSDKYVIGMTGNSTAVVISGYDTKTVTVYNPQSGKKETLSRTQAEEMFKNGGNRFVSWL